MTWPLVTTPVTVDTDFLSGNQSLTIQAAPERTSQAVVDTYTNYLNTIKGALNTNPPTDSAAQQLVAAMDGLRSLALNGIQGPPVISGGAPVTYSVTVEMAKQIDMLSRTLRAAGIFEDQTSTINATHLGTWQDLSTQGLSTVLQNAQFAASDNNSFQAMIELQYVQTGTQVLNQQLTTLQTALQSTQKATTLLGQLQQIHNDIAPSTTGNTNSLLEFTNPTQYVANNQQAIFNLLSPAEQNAFGLSSPSQITPTNYVIGNTGNLPSFNGVGIIDNIMWRIFDPVFGSNQLNPSDPTTQQELIKAGIIVANSSGQPTDTSGNVVTDPSKFVYNAAGTLSFLNPDLNNEGASMVLGSTPPSPATAQQQAIFDLLTPDQRQAIAQDLNSKFYFLSAGNNPPVLSATDIGTSTINSFITDNVFGILIANPPPTLDYSSKIVTLPGSSVSTIVVNATYDASKQQAFGIKYTLLEQSLFSGSPTAAQIVKAGIDNIGRVSYSGVVTGGSSPDFNLASERLAWAQEMTPAQQQLFGVQIVTDGNGNPVDASIANSGSPANDALNSPNFKTNGTVAEFEGTNASAWTAWYEGNFFNKTGDTSQQTAALAGIDANFTQAQLLAVGIDTTLLRTDPLLAVQGTVTEPQYDNLAQSLYGQQIPSVVNFNGQSEEAVYTHFESVRTQLAALVTSLNQLSPGSSSNPSTLAGQITQCLTDIQSKVGDPNSPGALAGFEQWILDNQGAGDTSTSGNNSGAIQTNIQAAITGASNLNGQQEQNFNSDMFVFQQFYQSASAMLTTLTQIIQEMGQNAGR